MIRPFHLLAAATLAVLSTFSSAQVGEKLPMDAQLDVVHPAAKTLAAFEGRAILIEFFAHW